MAAAWAGFTTDVFCEQDKFCQSILRKHWPHIPIVEDIFEFDGKKHIGATLFTAGFPCQPTSCAGKRRGKEDERWIWPEIIRVIRECKPKWVLLENVRGLTSLNGGVEFENLLLDLEDSDYETRAFLIPACGVDAPHKRERVWIVAHSNGAGGRSESGDTGNERWPAGDDRRESIPDHPRREESITKCDAESAGVDEREVVADTHSKWQQQSERYEPEGWRRSSDSSQENVADPKSVRFNNGDDCQLFGQATRKIYTSASTSGNCRRLEAWEWKTDTGICRISNGISNRVDRLRSLGNAIVPQVAFQIIQAIKEIEIQKKLDIHFNEA